MMTKREMDEGIVADRSRWGPGINEINVWGALVHTGRWLENLNKIATEPNVDPHTAEGLRQLIDSIADVRYQLALLNGSNFGRTYSIYRIGENRSC